MLIQRYDLSRALREPLVHFLLIGAAIFGLDVLAATPDGSGASNRIVISGGDIDRLSDQWETLWQRPPTTDEINGFIEERIREEVFYREALALGLDRDDVVIRRLLRRKLEFVTQDILVPSEPPAAELTAYYEANADRYTRPPLLSFSQIYFATDRRGGAAGKDARVVLARLDEGLDESSAHAAGDGQLFPDTFTDQTTRDIEAVFGPEYAASVAHIEPGVWSGPIASAYGLHLVRIDARRAGAVLAYAEVADKVRADWDYEQRQKANDEMYRSLRARYEVIVEPAAQPKADGEGQN
jgi:hypothetical protein